MPLAEPTSVTCSSFISVRLCFSEFGVMSDVTRVPNTLKHKPIDVLARGLTMTHSPGILLQRNEAAGCSLGCGDKTEGGMEYLGLFFTQVRQCPLALAAEWRLRALSRLSVEVPAPCVLPQGTWAGRGADGRGEPA